MKQVALIINIIILLILFLGLNSCRNESEKLKLDQRSGMNFPDYQERNTGLGNILLYQDTLRIMVEFGDCGEWGGHQEKISLYRNSNEKIVGILLIDSVSCENIKNFGNYSAIDDRTREIVKTVEKELNTEDEKLINLFIHRIIELKLNKESLSNTEEEIETIRRYIDAGITIHIQNTKSTLMIHYWNIDEETNTWYGKVRKEVFGISIEK